jgi:hypothetical protein
MNEKHDHETPMTDEEWETHLKSNPLEEPCLHCAMTIMVHKWAMRHLSVETQSGMGELIAAALSRLLGELISTAPEDARITLLHLSIENIVTEMGLDPPEVVFVPRPDPKKETLQ